MAEYENNSLDEEDIRLTAYYLWEQEGHGDTDPSYYWNRALAMHRRAHQNGVELEAGLASQRTSEETERSAHE